MGSYFYILPKGGTDIHNRLKKDVLLIAILVFFVFCLWFLLISSWYGTCSGGGRLDIDSRVFKLGPFLSQSDKTREISLQESDPGNRSSLDDGKPSNTSMKQICYYWMPRKNGKAVGGFITPRDIDPTICSHIIISAANIQNKSITPLVADDIKIYQEVMKLKERNPNLLVLLCLVNGFATLVRDPKAVDVFAFNARQFLETHGFDGLDLDWEFPSWPVWQRDRRERKWFTYLLLQLNNALKLASHPPMLLTVAVGAPQSIVDNAYDVPELAKYVDYVSVMGYDYHMFQSYMPFTGYNAPLSRGLGEVGFLATLNIQWCANYWVEKGMPKEKVVVGIPTYGRTWKLLSEEWHTVGAPAIGRGMLGGVISYTEACIFVKEGAMHYFDENCQVPYSVRGRDWVSYEDAESIAAKAQWIKESGFAGIMIWNLNSDDWAGLCSGERFELHKIIKRIISV